MRGSVFYLVFAAGIALTACETTQTVIDDDPAVGIRREPCGGGPVFPPEETVAQPPDNADAPAHPEKEPG